MKKIIAVFITSLGVFEIFSFFVVYFSNKDLVDTITLLNQTRHLIVPNIHVLPSLEKILPAFCASLFITFTAGVALSLIIGLVAMILVRSLGFESSHSSLFFLVSLSGFILSGLIFFSDTGPSVFHRARDTFLLSSKPGKMLNDFYYRYTPYAARAINSPLQQQMKICWIDSNLSHGSALNTLLLKSGWINIPNQSAASLIVENASEGLVLLKQGRTTILSVSMKNFEDDPVPYLKEFSQKTDTRFLLRSSCSVGLLVATPFVFFMILFSAMFFLYTPWTGEKPAIYLSGISMVAFALIAFFYLNPPMVSTDINTLLKAKNTRVRTEALRILYQKGGNISQIQAYLNRPFKEKSIAEKYWLAVVLSNPYPKNIPYIKELIKDNALNVRCSAIKALSRSGCSPESVKLFREIVEISPHWYEQNYALNAFRSCQ